MSIEAMKQALEVLEDFVDDPRVQHQIDAASAALRQAIAEAEKRCEYCDGTGDVHDQIGEWRGVCVCEAGKAEKQEPVATGIEAQVCADIAQRQQLGLAKYGMSVADNPAMFRAWLQHAYEECLDQAVYLKKAIELHDQAL